MSIGERKTQELFTNENLLKKKTGNFSWQKKEYTNWMEEAKGRIQYLKTSPKITSELDQIALQWQHESHKQQSNVSFTCAASDTCNWDIQYWQILVSLCRSGQQWAAQSSISCEQLAHTAAQQQLLSSASSASSTLLWTQTYRWQETEIKTIQANRSKVMEMPNCPRG